MNRVALPKLFHCIARTERHASIPRVSAPPVLLVAAVLAVLLTHSAAVASQLAVGQVVTLWVLTEPDRFGWPAIFVCRRQPDDLNPFIASASGPDETNDKLGRAGIGLEDCRGGFTFRSLTPKTGKISVIEGEVEGAGAGSHRSMQPDAVDVAVPRN